MQFKHKLIYFALGCAFVVIAQVLLSVVIPKVTAQGKRNPASELYSIQEEQTGKYRIYQPTTSTSFDFLLNTETGDCWRMVLNVNDAGPAWIYMPKETPVQWENWILEQIIQQKQVDQKSGGNESRRRDTQNFPSSTQPWGKYPKVGGEHWVSEVFENGKYIILEDKSLWEVGPIYQIYTRLWLAKESITVVENAENYYFPYKLTNSAKERTIEAKYLGISK